VRMRGVRRASHIGHRCSRGLWESVDGPYRIQFSVHPADHRRDTKRGGGGPERILRRPGGRRVIRLREGVELFLVT
jgi:hypothetical protein